MGDYAEAVVADYINIDGELDTNKGALKIPDAERMVKPPTNCKHKNKKGFNTATCKAGGEAGWECQDCGYRRVTAASDPLPHTWGSATCVKRAVCTVCGAKGSYGAHNMRPADCENPKRCINAGCNYSIGSANGHGWQPATCTRPRTCDVCGKTEGSTTNHKLIPADCTHPAVCKTCNNPIGSALGHDKITLADGKKFCKRCNNIINKDGSLTPHTHVYEFVSCTSPKQCVCGAWGPTSTVPGHSYYPGTTECQRPDCSQHKHHYTEFVSCTSPKKCICGKEGNSTTIPGHLYYPGTTTCRRAGCGIHVHRYDQFVSCTSPKKCVCGAQGGSMDIPGHEFYEGSTSNCKRGNCNLHTHIFNVFISNSVPMRCICGAEDKGLPVPIGDYYFSPTMVEAINVQTNHAGDPINTFTGAHEISYKVISVGGFSDLTLNLNYKSNKLGCGIFGKGFYWNYESFILEKDGDIQLYHSPSDYVLYTEDGDSDVYVTTADGSENDKLIKNYGGSYSLITKERTLNYDSSGKLVKVTEKTGEEIVLEYKEDCIDIADGVSGQTISLYFNDKHLVKKVTNNASAEASFEYDENGHLVKYTDLDGFVTEYTYDDKGRVLTGTDSDKNLFFANTYDEEGRVVKQKDALGKESFFSYEDNGENGKTTVFTDRNNNSKTYTFDRVGRQLSLTDEEGNTTRNVYDERGNCIEKVDALGVSVLMEYDERDNLIKQTDALGNETVFEYDENDNVVKIIYADDSEVTFTYDEKNRLVSSTDLRGAETTNTYDEHGYLVSTKNGDKVISYTYENGNLKTVTDPFGRVLSRTNCCHLQYAMQACCPRKCPLLPL